MYDNISTVVPLPCMRVTLCNYYNITWTQRACVEYMCACTIYYTCADKRDEVCGQMECEV